ncbi:MAG: dimeric dUTPase (all-alpha-NTP-PPase superfamily) [Cellvibrionaceae bacterium]|jgi:dimeric dUTPase (all-alpha-NTP-PPase superfamily)
MQTQLQIMLELQDAMNTRVNLSWRSEKFEWYRAIWIECAELMDHYGWKWWKHQSPDLEQVKLELIDIWHFGLSILLQDNIPSPVILVELEEALGSDKKDDFKDILENFALSTLESKDFSIPLFVALLEATDMSFDDLYCGYVGKNVLNFFRQDHGYKDGSYKKVWGGKEDNEHLVELVSKLDTSDKQFSDKLYAGLKARYCKL